MVSALLDIKAVYDIAALRILTSIYLCVEAPLLQRLPYFYRGAATWADGRRGRGGGPLGDSGNAGSSADARGLLLGKPLALAAKQTFGGVVALHAGELKPREKSRLNVR